MRPILRLLPLEYWRNLRVGSKLQPADQLLQDRPGRRRRADARSIQNLPAGQVRVERELAGQVADQPLDLHGLLPAIQPGDARGAGVGAQKRHQQANGGGFAGAVGAKKAEDLALLHLKRQIDDAALAAIALGQSVDFNDCRHTVFASSAGT